MAILLSRSEAKTGVLENWHSYGPEFQILAQDWQMSFFFFIIFFLNTSITVREWLWGVWKRRFLFYFEKLLNRLLWIKCLWVHALVCLPNTLYSLSANRSLYWNYTTAGGTRQMTVTLPVFFSPSGKDKDCSYKWSTAVFIG